MILTSGDNPLTFDAARDERESTVGLHDMR
jgi:hypothetical protein